MRRSCFAAAFVTAALAACDLGGGVYLLSEAEGVEVVRDAFEARGYLPEATDHAVTGAAACPEGEAACEPSVTYVLDGWDPAAEVGFEYAARWDPDFAARADLTAGSVVEVRDALAALEASTNTSGAPAVVLVFRPWAHETELLAREQLRRAVDDALDAAGL